MVGIFFQEERLLYTLSLSLSLSLSAEMHSLVFHNIRNSFGLVQQD